MFGHPHTFGHIVHIPGFHQTSMYPLHSFAEQQDPAWLACCAVMALEERARSCLLRFRHRLEQDIKPTYLMDHMISDGVMTGDEEERIRTQVSLCFTWEGEGEMVDNLESVLFNMFFFCMMLLFVTASLSSVLALPFFQN